MSADLAGLLQACTQAQRAADWERATVLAQQAVALAPEDPLAGLSLAECALRRPSGVQEAHDIVTRHWDAVLADRALARKAWEALMRACDHDRLAQLPPVLSLYTDVDPAIVPFMPVPLRRLSGTAAEYDALIAFQGRWAEQAMAQAAADPLPPAVPVAKSRPRIGLLTERWLPMIVQALDPVVDGLRKHFDLFGYCAPVADRNGATGKLLRRLHRVSEATSMRALALAVQEDGIDLLIDLNGLQQSGSLSAVMAWRPAPVQIIWLARPSPLPLPVVDLQLLDPHLLAPTPWHAESARLLPNAWACFHRPASLAIDPEPPSARTGMITVGTMQPPEYLREETIALWARVLLAIPKSRFLMIRPECASPIIAANLTRAFGRHGVAADRLAFERNQKGVHHLTGYAAMDIALDAVPISAGMVTMEALWMGVPVVSWAGPQSMHRLGATFLANAGAGDLAVTDTDAYVAAATALAGDLDRRRTLRTSLRAALSASPLCDADKFVKSLIPVLRDLVTPAA